MTIMRKQLFIMISFLCCVSMYGQFSHKMIIGFDFYQKYRNPQESKIDDDSRSSGNVILAIPIGYSLAIGKNNVSFSAEASANIAPLAFDAGQYKGLGALSFPLLAKLNFGALSGFSKNKLLGYSIGGGIQFNRTELFGLTKKYNVLERNFFPTYVGELGVGGGVSGLNVILYFRVGAAAQDAFSFNSGLIFNVDLYKTKTKVPKKPKLSSMT